jgi:sugar phosphate isomerase/epimerase
MKVSAINSGGIEYLFHLALVHEDARKAESAIAILKHNIRHCHRLGCMQQIGVARGFAVPGRPMRWFKDCLVDVLREASGYAVSLNVPIVFEYTNRFEINTINIGAKVHAIVERVGSPNLGILVDTYHSFLEDPDIHQNIRDLNGHIRHFHLHDSNRGAALIAGGENDFDRIVEACGKIGYHGWFSDGLLTLQYSEAQLRQSTLGLKCLYDKYGV